VSGADPFFKGEGGQFHKMHVWNADSLVGYLYSTSFASRAVLGDLQEPFEMDLRTRLARYSADDEFPEAIDFTIISASKVV
jgi:hypothetical protein